METKGRCQTVEILVMFGDVTKLSKKKACNYIKKSVQLYKKKRATIQKKACPKRYKDIKDIKDSKS